MLCQIIMQHPAEAPVHHQETILQVEGVPCKAYLFSSCHHPYFSSEECDSLLQSRAYHAALESAPPERMAFWYVRLEQNGELLGILSFQVKDFNPGQSLRNQMNGSLINKMRYKAASLIDVSVLCLGNTLVTGDYGFCFSPGVPERQQTLLMMETIEWMLSLPAFKKIGLVFVKDFYRDIFQDIPGSAHCRRYHPIDTQPSMVMDIHPGWQDLNGYLKVLKSKYRIRANKALELSRELTCTELGLEEIVEIEPHLHQLYMKVVDDVGFNLFILSEGYFSALKRSLGDRFRLWVYKDREEIISFFTIFEDGEILDAHFLGYDPEVNHRYKLYLNMLLAMIDMASRKGFKKLYLSRTATEIKSSVGAKGLTMWAYLRATRPVFNWLVPRVYSFFKPNLDWEPRHPFHQ